ncbi:hypothetical protein BSR29_02755 [Boudabousia liubingyangii]|uniref:PTS EIIB type-1 domain-containing protein n=1 Tax=Boudabousia liubingyangii TaxID=1921764 RepID=A0A1Q5PMU2_9ACTO|nr:PTS transporter subunit EIIB [Boudabousia liubingyangii]OKL47424.1 hypothetical protein BSR28_02615 [Boudabousia liubingyangii]OKL48795.1 hypothetical protein BSR29_02755 [Boudabousia liubingyangii]
MTHEELLVLQIIEGVGGITNLAKMDAIGKRLRLEVRDRSLVNPDFLRQLETIAVVVKDECVQIIAPREVDEICKKLASQHEDLWA